jgi:hypothetical protein
MSHTPSTSAAVRQPTMHVETWEVQPAGHSHAGPEVWLVALLESQSWPKVWANPVI